MAKSSGKQLNIAGNLWLVALLLLLLVVITAALVCSIMNGYSQGDDNVIALFPGDPIDQSGYKNNYIVSNPKPGFEASDDVKEWEVDTTVDLFRSSYTNEKGEVIIESANGDKVIAPGATNSYTFSLKNTGNISIDYTMTMRSIFELLNHDLPFEVRLASGSDWVLGNDYTWLSPDSLLGLTFDGTLPRGRYVSYTLEWRWPFERYDPDTGYLDDVNDVLVGNAAAFDNKDVNFTLEINTVAEITPGAFPVDENGNAIVDVVTERLDVVYIGIFVVAGVLVLGLLLWALILLLLLLRRRSKEKEGAEPPPME